jgi:hypothetical protein
MKKFLYFNFQILYEKIGSILFLMLIQNIKIELIMQLSSQITRLVKTEITYFFKVIKKIFLVDSLIAIIF